MDTQSLQDELVRAWENATMWKLRAKAAAELAQYLNSIYMPDSPFMDAELDAGPDRGGAMNQLVLQFNGDSSRPLGICESCGAKMVEYTFSFNRGLASTLLKIAAAEGPVELRKLGLTTSQWTNAAKLRYWQLALPVEMESKQGWWEATPLGKLFVEGKAKIPRLVVMYRNKFVRYGGQSISMEDAESGYDYRPHYRDQAREQIVASQCQ